MVEITTLMQLTPLSSNICEIVYSYLHVIIIKCQNDFLYFDGTRLHRWIEFHHVSFSRDLLVKLGEHILFINRESFYALNVEIQLRLDVMPARIKRQHPENIGTELIKREVCIDSGALATEGRCPVE